MAHFDHVLTEAERDAWWRYFNRQTDSPPLDAACPTYLEFGPPLTFDDPP